MTRRNRVYTAAFSFMLFALVVLGLGSIPDTRSADALAGNLASPTPATPGGLFVAEPVFTAASPIVALAVGNDGLLYLLTYDGEILKISPDGTSTSLASGLLSCSAFSSHALVALPDGSVIANSCADTNDVLIKIDPAGSQSMLVQLESQVLSMASDASGNVYVGTWSSEGDVTLNFQPSTYLATAVNMWGQISLIDPSGTLSTIYEGGLPLALHVSETGDLYAAVWGQSGGFRAENKSYSVCDLRNFFWITLSEQAQIQQISNGQGLLVADQLEAVGSLVSHNGLFLAYGFPLEQVCGIYRIDQGQPQRLSFTEEGVDEAITGMLFSNDMLYFSNVGGNVYRVSLESLSATPEGTEAGVMLPAASLTPTPNVVVIVITNTPVPAIIHPSPTAAAVAEASPVDEQMNRALSTPVEFYIPDGSQGPWQLTPGQLREMLVIEHAAQPDGTSADQVLVNVFKARAFLATLAADLTVSPVNARFSFSDETRQLEVVEPGVNGRTLDMDSTLARFETALFAIDPADRRVALIFQDMIPTVNDQATASDLGVTELVVQRTTYYDDAHYAHIQAVAERFHGLVIPPNEEFSFNEWLGDTGVEPESAQGMIIAGNQVITGVDGGACQVATTAFQTAFYGGYPILERVEHAYRVISYEGSEGPGMDAAVDAPVADFRFLNDTPYHLLIEVDVNPDDSSITWKLYSTGMNRRVIKEGPFIRNEVSPPPPIYRANPALGADEIRQVGYAVSGSDVDVYRTVYEGDRVIIDREEYHSHYLPWADTFEVAPGDARIND